MERNKKNRKIIFLLLLLLLFLVFFGVILFCTKKPVVAFFGIDELVEKNITEQLESMPQENGKPFKFKTKKYQNSLPLLNQMHKTKRPDIIFLPQGVAQDYAIGLAKKVPFDDALLDDMPMSFLQTVKKDENGSVKSFPVLADSWEFLYDTTNYVYSGLNAIVSLHDIEKLGTTSMQSASKMPASFMFAAKDAGHFWGVMTALCEAVGGKELVQKAKAQIADSVDYKATAQILCGDEGALNEVISMLVSWKNQKILYPSCLDFSFEEAKAFLDENFAACTFIPLSCHRMLDLKALNRYSYTYIPGLYLSGNRNFVANITCAVPMKNNKTVAKITQYLLSSDTQADLARRTGLVPVSKSCTPPDRQTDDARYWIAATNAPCPTLFYDAFPSVSFAQSLADEIISYIKQK